MRYTLVSDLHLNHPQPKTPRFDTDLVVVAGDCANGLEGLKYLNNKIIKRGHTLFALDGNHEHYSNRSQKRTLDETETQFFQGCNQTGILDIAEEKIRFLGRNGWYQVSDERHWLGYMNDGLWSGSSAEVINDAMSRHAEWMAEQLSQLPKEWRAIVVTHTAPTIETLDPRYIGSDGNDYYWSPAMWEVLNQFNDRIAVWNHGHTHAPADKIINGVRVVCNPRGYPRENPDWKPKVIEV